MQAICTESAPAARRATAEKSALAVSYLMVGLLVVITILIICQCPNFLAPGVASPTASLL